MTKVKPPAVRVCEACGSEFLGRKRRFCYGCLPEHQADPELYRRRYNELMLELRVVVDKTCVACGRTYRRGGNGGNRCWPCVKADKKACRGCGDSFSEPKKILCSQCRTVLCAECGSAFVPLIRRDPVCSEECRAARAKKRRRRERFRRRSAPSGPYHVLEVFDRDRWRCGICGGLTLPWQPVPHPKAATIDHIVPLAAGGTDTADNVQCAHFACNSAKGARGGGEQLRIVG